MGIELTNELKETYIETAKQLKGSDRRLFMARIVRSLGRGGQRLAARELGWDRKTIRKGGHELDSGIVCIDNFSARGRKPVEAKLPELRQDMRAILDGQSQTDPTFRSQRLYTRLTVKEVRRQLIDEKGYTDDQLPGNDSLRTRINEMGYRLRGVRKSQPEKKFQKPTPSSTS
jgi:hypothetical protein